MNRSVATRRGGVSLLEVLTVLVVLAILAGAVAPLLMPAAGQQVQSIAEMVAADMAYARGLAVANGSKYRLTFVCQENFYKLKHSGTNATLNKLPTGPMGSPSDPADERVVRLDELSMMGTKVRIAGVLDASGAAVSEIEFGPLGSTTSKQELAVWLVAGSGKDARYASVVINPVTGLATFGSVRDSAPPGLAEPVK